MIGKDLEAEILRLYHAEKWLVGSISRQLEVHHSAVQRVIAREGLSRSESARPRMIEPFMPFLKESLAKYPTLTACRLHEMVKVRGYTGKASQFRAIIAELRGKRRAEPFLRLKVLAGEQAQVDWGHFGRLECGQAQRPLMAFVMVLSHSRAIFLRFFLSQNLSAFLSGHELAFQWFGGVPRVCLYDNLRSVVLERVGSAIRFNPHFVSFAGHCRFEPRPVAVARGNEKGRVERSIRYIRSNFFPARRFKDIDDLNTQALKWCETESLERRWVEDSRRSVGEVFSEEKKALLPLPENRFPCEERKAVEIGKTPYARFDLNDYSVPPAFAQKTLTILASQSTVRVLDGDSVVAVHARTYDRGKQVTDPEHNERLRAMKAEAGQHGRAHLLAQVAPSSTKLLSQLSQRGSVPLSRASNELLSLLNTFGAAELEDAIAEALLNNAPHPHAVRHICERRRKESGREISLPLSLPDDPRIQNMYVKPHKLNDYDNLLENTNDNTDND